jgi:pimeloyl-ACP methyl ester carboxylesterase
LAAVHTPSPQPAPIDLTVGREGQNIYITAQDGLRLHVREHSARNACATPVVCLPGLTRTTADFDALAPFLAYGEPKRRVIAIDSRGRGQSQYDPNPQNYNVAVELADVIAVLTALGISRAVFVGSSRGGILTMLLAATEPTTIAGAVLHDIGPVIEPKGLARIKSYVGKMPQPASFAEGAEILRRLFSSHFSNLTTEQWLAAAKRAWKLENGTLVPTYDVKLSHSLAEFDSEHSLPPLWNEFDALAKVPVLVIRGANSDILSVETVNAMRARHQDLEVIEVADQGHVPILEGNALLGRIASFVRRCDDARQPKMKSHDQSEGQA